MGGSAPGGRLEQLGWSVERARLFGRHAAEGYVPGRVVATGGATIAATVDGPAEVVVQRRAERELAMTHDEPAVGDWLALAPLSVRPPTAALRAILPREGTFVRQRSGAARPQVLAANVDVAFVVAGLDHDLNLRRLERYLVLAFDGGVTPVVLLNKVDIAVDLAAMVADVHGIAAGARVIVTSALEGTGLDEVRELITPATTACLLGSSGVGKSTITNALLDSERQAVRDLREDDSKGRHTTTRRELFSLARGGLLIDSPGLRTVGVLGERDAVEASFEEIARLSQRCRFSDCQHDSEPDCAVRRALTEGSLAANRYASYRKLEAERHSAEVRADERTRRAGERRLGRMYRSAAREARARRSGS